MTTYSSYRPVRKNTKPPAEMTPLRGAVAFLLFLFCALVPVGFGKYALENSRISLVTNDAQRGNLTSLEARLKANPDLLNAEGYLGRTPAYFAAANGNTRILEFLQEKKAELNKPDQRGWTPLHAAAAHNQRDAVMTLIDLTVKLTRDKQGGTALHAAATGFNQDAAAVLVVDMGFDVNATDNAGLTPLHVAARYKEVAMAEFLIKNGANVNAKTKNGSSPLDIARETPGNQQMVNTLVDRGAE